MRILLIRHGRSAHTSPRGLLDRADVERWRSAYDAAGIAHDDHPPASVQAEVARADLLAASDYARALESAARIAPGRDVQLSPLFREIPLATPHWAPSRAPFGAWGAFIHLEWTLETLRGRSVPTNDLPRVQEAVRWCRDVSSRPSPEVSSATGTVAIVTHGVFRRELSRALCRDGWRFAAGRRSYAHWSVWRLDSN